MTINIENKLGNSKRNVNKNEISMSKLRICCVTCYSKHVIARLLLVYVGLNFLNLNVIFNF